jgi:hypothetical protein
MEIKPTKRNCMKKNSGFMAFIAEIMLVFIFIGCTTTAQPVEKDKTVTFPNIANFTVWQSEVVYTQVQRKSRNLNLWPDGNIGVVNKGDGNYTFYAANGSSTNMAEGNLDKPAQNSNRNITILKQKNTNLNYMAGGPVYKLNEDTLLLFYHSEISPRGDGREFYSMLGVAVSTTKDRNGNFIQFEDLGFIISSNRPFRDIVGEGQSVEMMGAGFAEYNGYLYVYFSDYIDGDSFGNINQHAVARASISEIATAVNTGTAPVFMKYFNGKFTENGLGGMSSPLEIGNPGTAWFDMSYNSCINKFLMFVTQWYASNNVKLYLAISDDGIKWSSRILIADEAGEIFYPSIIGLGDDPRITGKEFYIYYTHSINGAWDRWSDAKLLRRKITLD